MITSTIENYIKQIYLRVQERADPLLPMGHLAAAMGVVPGTATAMVKTLADAGLVQYEPRGGIRLTAGGERLALHVLRRHRIVELFLVEILGLDWSEVHEEAEALEHVVSEKVLSKMDNMLNHPQYDPHGDPIPNESGQLAPEETCALSVCPARSEAVVARVADQDAGFLQFAERHRLIPGASIWVEESDAQADSVTVRFSDRSSFTLGSQAADKIFVRLLR